MLLLLEEALLLDLELDFELVDLELVEDPDFELLETLEVLEVLEILEVGVLLGSLEVDAIAGLPLLTFAFPKSLFSSAAYAVSDQTEQVKISVSAKMT